MCLLWIEYFLAFILYFGTKTNKEARPYGLTPLLCISYLSLYICSLIHWSCHECVFLNRSTRRNIGRTRTIPIYSFSWLNPYALGFAKLRKKMKKKSKKKATKCISHLKKTFKAKKTAPLFAPRPLARWPRSHRANRPRAQLPQTSTDG